MIKFAKFTSDEQKIVSQIVDRAISMAVAEGITIQRSDMEMDIAAAHADCPLALTDLLNAKNGDFGHDVFGIRRYMNRKTGKLENCFLPRAARK